MVSTNLLFKKSVPFLPTLFRALCLPRPGIQLGSSLPHLSAEIFQVRIDQKNLDLYNHICLIESSDILPPLYPHVLAGTLHLQILTHSQFPLNIIGSVHKSNTIKQWRSLKKNDVFDIKARLGHAKYIKKGIEFNLETDIFCAGELVWSEVSTYFKKTKFPDAIDRLDEDTTQKIDTPYHVSSWKIAPSLGKLYALVSKDFNPIHLSKWPAKAFGFERDLAHGQAIWAQALSKIGLKNFGEGELKINFKGPCYMGKELKVCSNIEKTFFQIYCQDNQRPVMSFEIKP